MTLSGEYLLANYRRRVIQETEYINFSGIPLPQEQGSELKDIQFPLNRLYVRIQAIQKGQPFSENQFTYHAYDERTSEATLTDIITTLSLSGEEFYRQGKIYRALERPEPISPQQALREFQRLIILGAPGSGKTILLQYLAHCAARDDDGPIPIRISLKDYVLSIARKEMFPLREFALNTAARQDSALRAMLEQTESILWLIDDLDTLQTFREPVVNQIIELPGEIVLTSRPVGYQRRGFELLPHFEILPMSNEETDDFLRDRFIALAEQRHAHWDWAEKRMSWLNNQLAQKPDLQPLINNPLLLTCLVVLSDQKQLKEIPEQRGELYRCCIESVLDFRETYPQSTPNIPRHSDNGLSEEESEELARQIILDGIYYIGLYLQNVLCEKPCIEKLLRKNLATALREFLKRIRNVRSKDRDNIAESILHFWLQTGVLESRTIEDEIYITFRHSLFQEYAAALGIAGLFKRDLRQAKKFLIPRLQHAAWQEPLLLVAELLEPEHVTSFASWLFRGISPYAGATHRDHRLAAKLFSQRLLQDKQICQKLTQQLGWLSSEYQKKHAIISRITYITGLLGSIGILQIMRPFSFWEALITLVLWTLIWYASFINPVLPRVQGILAIPKRLWPATPNREPVMQIFDQCKSPETKSYLIQALSDEQSNVRRVAAEILGNLEEIEAVPSLLQMLHDPQENVRRTAALALGNIGAIPRLVQALHDDNANVHKAAADALSRIDTSQTIPILSLVSQDSKDYVRRTAVDILKQIGSKQAVPSLVKTLNDSDKYVRLTATEALGEIGRNKNLYAQLQIVSYLIKALDDEEPRVRWAAAYALGQLKDPDLIPVFIGALRKSHDFVSRAISDAVLQTVTENSVPHLVKSLKDEDPHVRRTAVEALGQLNIPHTVPELINALQDSERSIRRDAARALGNIGDPKAVSPLLECLDDNEWWVRWACAEALGKIGVREALPSLIQMTKDCNGYVCRAAIEALGKLGGTETVPYLIQALKSKREDIQLSAEHALQHIGEAQTTPYLIQALKDQQTHVQKDAEDALRHIGDIQAVPYLIQALQEPEDYVRKTAAETLGRIGSREASHALIQLLNDCNATVRSTAAEALGAIGDIESISALTHILQDLDSNVRRAAAKALGRIGTHETVFSLTELLNDSNMNVRRAAVESLGRIGNSEAVPFLLEALQDSGWWVRWNAAYALGKIGEIQAIPLLIQTLQENNDTVRGASAEALGQIGNLRAVPPLMKVLSDKNWSVRWAAAYALGQIGDSLSIPRLIESLNDNHAKVRWAAAEALGKIGEAEAAPALIQLLIDGNADVRKAAARSLSQISDVKVIPALLEAMRKNNEYVRRITLNALHQIHAPQAIPYLIEALKNEETFIQKTAADNLIRLGNSQAIPGLISVLTHHNWIVRKLAAEILGELAYTLNDLKLLKRTARALWWRLTDVDDVAKAAFCSLDQIVNRMTVVKVASLPSPRFLSTRTKSKPQK